MAHLSTIDNTYNGNNNVFTDWWVLLVKNTQRVCNKHAEGTASLERSLPQYCRSGPYSTTGAVASNRRRKLKSCIISLMNIAWEKLDVNVFVVQTLFLCPPRVHAPSRFLHVAAHLRCEYWNCNDNEGNCYWSTIGNSGGIVISHIWGPSRERWRCRWFALLQLMHELSEPRRRLL